MDRKYQALIGTVIAIVIMTLVIIFAFNPIPEAPGATSISVGFNATGPITMGTYFAITADLSGYVLGIPMNGSNACIIFYWSTDNATWSVLGTENAPPGGGTVSVNALPTAAGTYYFMVNYTGNSQYASTNGSAVVTIGKATSTTMTQLSATTPIWSTYWIGDLPTATGGYWTFSIPAYTSTGKQANFANMTGYGTYEMRLKTINTRQAGVNWWIFLDGPYGDYNPNQMELDFAEIYGWQPNNEYSLGFWVNGTTSDTGGIGYWFIDTTQKGVSFDDGSFHVFTYVYTPSDLTINIDGIQIFDWQTDCTNKTALGLPVPPMQFMIGMKGDGSQALDASMIVDYITYAATSYPPVITTMLSSNNITAIFDTATVTGLGGSFPVPTGTVQFMNNDTGAWVTFDTESLAGGSATSSEFNVNHTGTFFFDAIYSGDGNYTANASGLESIST